MAHEGLDGSSVPGKKIKEEKGNNERSIESLLDGTGGEALREPSAWALWPVSLTVLHS